MATEKILNTRIQLKYDTLANWNNSTFILKKGEVAVVTVPTVEGSTLEPVMFKVGDGAKTFKQLDWASAKAADVYSWAKQAGISVVETDGTNDGSYVTGLKWENNQLVPEIVAFDAAMSATSTNAVQNKVIKQYVDDAVAGVIGGEVKNAEYATEAGKATNDGNGNNIVDTYATKAELEKELWAKDTVTTVTGKDAIKVQDTDTDDTNYDYKVELVINAGTPGNVTLTQDANGLKANTTPEAIGAKSKQTAVTDKITDKAHVLDSLTQNENGEISYEVRTLTPDDIGAKSKQTTVSKTLTGAQVVGTISQNENGVITVTDRTITAADLGLDSAMHFIGVFATAPTKGPNDRALQNGDVYLNSANNIEYVWADNKWNELGDADSHALKSTGIIADNGLTSTAKLDGTGSIGIADSGVTTAKIADKAVTKAKLADEVLGDLGEKTVKTYVDDAISGVVGGEVTNAKHADEATKATKDGNDNVITETYKVKQTAVSDPTANGKSLTFIDSISQNTEGVITATKKNVDLDDYALKTDIPEIPDIVITETKGELGTGGTIFVSGKLAADTATGHTLSQPMFGLTQQGDIEFVTDNKQTIEVNAATTKAVSFAIKDGAVTAEKTAAYTTENSDGTHTASTEVWVLYGGSATENI